MLYLYTDGSSTGRANREWGYGWVLVENDKEIAFGFDGGSHGTNNVAELFAAIAGLDHVWTFFPNVPITLVSDSLYVLKTASGEYTAKKNIEMCKQLREVYLLLNAEQQWVKGHSGNKWNCLADELANQGKARYAPNKTK